jgi:hypothetical protein
MKFSPCEHTTEMCCVYFSVSIGDRAGPSLGRACGRRGPLARFRQRQRWPGCGSGAVRQGPSPAPARGGDCGATETLHCVTGGKEEGRVFQWVGGRAGDSASLHETLARLGQDMIQCNGLDCCTTQRYKSAERVSNVWNRVRAPSSTGIFGKATN